MMNVVNKLDVYILAESLSDLIWYAFDKWSRKVQNTIGYQIIKSGESIAANIAEGYGRYTPEDRRNFYRYTRGSLEKTKAWLRKLVRRNIITFAESKKYADLLNESGPKLNAFINSMK